MKFLIEKYYIDSGARQTFNNRFIDIPFSNNMCIGNTILNIVNEKFGNFKYLHIFEKNNQWINLKETDVLFTDGYSLMLKPDNEMKNIIIQNKIEINT
jgi:hypothetical protein